jgi:hypothetical protein
MTVMIRWVQISGIGDSAWFDTPWGAVRESLQCSRWWHAVKWGRAKGGSQGGCQTSCCTTVVLPLYYRLH